MSNTDNAILSALRSDKSTSKTALLEATGIRKSTLTRALDKLVDNYSVHTFEDDGEWFYQLPLSEEAQTEEAAPQRPARKWERTLEMARQGTTVEQVANTLGMGHVAARSQLQDLRRRGYKLTHKGGWYTAE